MRNPCLKSLGRTFAQAASPLAFILVAQPLVSQTAAIPPGPPAIPVLAPTLATSRDFTFAVEDHPVRIDQVAGHIQVFILEDMERSGARTLGEFLAQELPAQFQQAGGPGLPIRAYQGGARPQDTLVLLDGLRMSDPNQAAPDLNTIPLTGIVRVELLTGTDSSRQGPGAQGGVVAIFTAGASDRSASGELAGQGGNSGQSQGRALPTFGWGSGWIHAGSQARKEDQATETQNGYRSASNFMAFGQRMGPATLSLSYHNFYQGVPDPYETVTLTNRVYDPTREASYRSQTGSMGLRFDLAPGAALIFTVGGQSIDRQDPQFGSTNQVRTTGRTNQADVALSFGVPSFGVVVHAGGFEAKGENPIPYIGTDEGKTRHTGVGLEARFEPVPSFRMTAEAGFQGDERRINPFGMASSERTDHTTTFRATANLSLPLGFRIYAGGGQGYTAPSLPQLFLNTRAGGPDLDVEKSGFGFFGFGFGKGHLSGRFEASRATYKNAIGFNGLVYVNQDHVRVQGTEAALSWSAGGFGVEGFVRAQEAKDLNAPTDPYGTAAASGRPFQSHGLKLFGGWSRVRLDLRYRTVGGNYQVTGPALRANGFLPPLYAVVVYHELSTTATVTLGKHWTVIARSENLLQPKTTVNEWLTQQTDTQTDAYRTYGIPSLGPRASLEVIFRY